MFSFRNVLPWKAYREILAANKYKATSGSIPTKVLQVLTKQTCISLTDCIKSSISNGLVPTELKMVDVVPIFKKDSPFDKTNYWPISLLPSLSRLAKR